MTYRFSSFATFWNQSKTKHKLIVAGYEVISLSLPEKPIKDSFNNTETFTIKLKELGSILNYYWGKRPDFLWVTNKTKYQNIYSRNEIPTLHPDYPNSIPVFFEKEYKELSQALKENGIEFITALIPSHLSIDRVVKPNNKCSKIINVEAFEKPIYNFNGVLPSEEKVYQTFIDKLQPNSIDLFSVYKKYLVSHPKEHIFLPYDMHLTSLGITLTAKAIVNHLKGHFQTEILAKGVALPDTNVNTLKALQLPFWFQLNLPSLNFYEPIYDLTRINMIKNSGRVIMAGSCHSRRLSDAPFADEAYSIGAVVARALGKNYLDVSADNQSPLGPLNTLHNEKWIFQKGDILIWEFPIQAALEKDEHFPNLYTTM